MEHPFTQKMELTDQIIEQVDGGLAPNSNLIEWREIGPAPSLRPPIGSTLAIGEEGGGFFY